MAETDNTILKMTGISKSFPGVQALESVELSLKQGEIHALVGENGAGKSTLIKVLTGVEHPDTGTITLFGRDTRVRSPQHAVDLGISTVYQENNLCMNLSVSENILIGREPMRFLWWKVNLEGMSPSARRILRMLVYIDWQTLNALAKKLLLELGVDIDVTQPLGSYSVAIQQMVAIARALEISNAKILIFDEPTSSLDLDETRQLFDVMKKLKQQGVGILFITHFLNQVYEVSDRITVLRNGKLVGTYDTRQLPHLDLIAKMIGRSLSGLDEMTKIKLRTMKTIKKEPCLTARGLGRAGAIKPFDLDLHRGEVVGLAGLLGSGRSEMASLLYGTETPDVGTLVVENQAVRDFSPLDSIKRGVVLCPEDRKGEGIVDDLTVRENIILALQASRGWLRYLSMAQQYEIAERYIKLLNISTPSADQAVKNLSGGNQQKVILARWLAANPEVMILDEPTRGIDVGTKTEIQKLVLTLAEEGKSCVFISSELEEVMRTSHRIVVMRDREKVNELAGETDEQKVMKVMAGSVE
ncbi:MAG: sugar ABC transporter ATP-binding protein [Anaerolineales bacterium]|nr:sugar ABC transporter ATP-binding protein [Anaerolineales bacterium]